jgi:hypothetical protein
MNMVKFQGLFGLLLTANLSKREDLPTPELPMRSTLKR